MKRFTIASLIITIVFILLSGCGTAATPTPTAAPDLPLTLSSTSFTDGGEIDPKYKYSMGGQCTGENISPQLSWTGGPAATQSLAVISLDMDDQSHWVHWVQFNIPPDVTELPEAIGGPDIGVKGRNYFYLPGYGGPCPPGDAHRYEFTLYALDIMLPLEANASYDKVVAAMEGHILEQVSIIGSSSR
jgi:Raf kinase inhibitor-like YbhB/YbcL family protein